MSDKDCDILLSAIKQNHDDLKEIININMSSVRGQMRDINDHLKTLNGTVATHQDIIKKRQKDVDDFHRLEKRLNGFRKKWMYILIGVAGVALVVTLLYDMLGLSGIINLIK